ncbi:hypothetical protein P343_07765 [Sporolactobacillus laevolacticus DSM 442]|uniref:Uncharacterized protein n=1 Tax=Sporolactobacillus laevolacticus DSM 442 TaxID=1395513 RepID=V6IXW1_9BACL|nr:hypothetical protein P343_07765 [Sporolactobacillus laevolacticus DSM 442]
MTTYPNSGMQLEHEIESSNLSYQLKGSQSFKRLPRQ